jgi:hypothetical protein
MIQELTAFLKGPVFVFSLVVALLGVFRLVFHYLHLIAAAFYNSWKYHGNASEFAMAALKKMTSIEFYRIRFRLTPVFWGAVAFAFVLSALFSIDHVSLIERRFGVGLFALSKSLGELMVVLCGVPLIVKFLMLSAGPKTTFGAGDSMWFFSLLLIVLASGLCASNANYPALLAYARFIHVFAGDFLIMIVPFSRIGYWLVSPLATITIHAGVWLLPDSPKRDETAEYFKRLSEKKQ